MPIEIPGFSDLLNEYNQRMADEVSINEQLQQARELAIEVWEQMEKARQFALEDILKERNLGLCGYVITNHHNSDIEAEEIGIFPREQLNYLYTEALKSQDEKQRLDCFCPLHYQLELDNYKASDDFHRSRWLLSEVEKRGDRLITVTSFIDVTDIPLQYKTAGMSRVYEYFGFPQLPPKPLFR